MGVPDDGDVIVGIEVSASLGVVHPDALRTYDVEGFIVEKGVGGSERPGAAGK
jgi:hypothetical protein